MHHTTDNGIRVAEIASILAQNNSTTTTPLDVYTEKQRIVLASVKTSSALLTIISTVLFFLYVIIFKARKFPKNSSLRLLIYLQICCMLSAIGNVYVLGTFKRHKVGVLCYFQCMVSMVFVTHSDY
jgi:hypothetical protein